MARPGQAIGRRHREDAVGRSLSADRIDLQAPENLMSAWTKAGSRRRAVLPDQPPKEKQVKGPPRYFPFYNHERLHLSLDYRTPAVAYEVTPSQARTAFFFAPQTLS